MTLGAVTLPVLTGCQGVMGPATRDVAQVRVINASPDAPPVDLYVGDNALAYSLTFGVRTTYVPVPEGSYLFHADGAGTRQALSAANAAVIAGRQYTAIVGDSLANLHVTLFADQTKAAPAGASSFRLMDQALRSGPVDVYLVASGSSLHTGSMIPAMNFGSLYDYHLVPVGSYRLTVMPAGTATGFAAASLYTSPQMSFTSGSVRTLVLLDRPFSDRTAGSGSIEAVVNEEGEPAPPN